MKLSHLNCSNYFFAVLLAANFCASSQALAAVGQSVKFVNPNSFSIGIEPELSVGNKAGVGVAARYTQGLTDLTNAFGVIGTSNGDREFRFGGGMTFDFFPDSGNQPGLGISLGATYYRLRASGGQFETAATPYVHKSFRVNGYEVDPYFSFPMALTFKDGVYKDRSSVVVGSLFEAAEKVRYLFEVGVAVNNSESFLSGGLIYYH